MVVTFVTLIIISWITKKLFTSGKLSSRLDILHVFDDERRSFKVTDSSGDKGYDNRAIDLKSMNSRSD